MEKWNGGMMECWGEMRKKMTRDRQKNNLHPPPAPAVDDEKVCLARIRRD
jgi:hypothetical protein